MSRLLLDPATWDDIAALITKDQGYMYDRSDRSHMTDMAQIVCEALDALNGGPSALDELDRLRAELADTPTLVNVGVNYCTVHHGIANEDDGPVCDFAGHNRRGSDALCDLRPLGYVS